MRIGIVGHGFVGRAVDYGFETPKVSKFLVDPIYGTTIKDLVAFNPTVVFVCVPTPMSDDGSVDASIVESVVSELVESDWSRGNLQLNEAARKLIVIKSTIPPSVTNELCYAYSAYLSVVYNPEFLTEKSAQEQFINPAFHVFGGARDATFQLEHIYNDYSLCNNCPTFHMTADEASFVKYAINSFLATKVTFFNQLFDACDDVGANFNRIIRAVGADPRIGNGHTRVPGYDKKKGFGGACFPKDTKAWTKYTHHASLLEKVIEINNEYRSQYEKDEREEAQNIKYD